MTPLHAATFAETIPGRRPHVLVVDDDEHARRTMSEAFEERGWDVLTATDALGAMRALVDHLFSLDLLATDVLMPGMGGEGLVRSIRHLGGESDLPILAVSGCVDATLEDRLRRAGADAVAAKSLGAASIVRRAEDVVAARRAMASAVAFG
jgi:CheY-like chemotaxis protein